VVARHVRYIDDREAPRDELFLAGTEQDLMAEGTQVTARQEFGIANPRDGSVFAIDPDIPPASQQLRFEGERGTWFIDGKPLGQGAAVAWAPWPGRHEVVLESEDGRRRSSARFEVRGASVKAASR
jgi:penicillin-binding protein 1C